MKHCIPAIKKLTALALTQPKETIPQGDYSRVYLKDRLFDVKIKSAIEMHQLTEIKNHN